MKVQFWKLSQGPKYFTHEEVLDSIDQGLVYVHKDTKGKGRSSSTQADDFVSAPVGDYFYLTNGNEGVYALGQFVGPANVLSRKGDGWLDRPFRLIRSSRNRDHYSGPTKWWTPDENSTFTRVGDSDLTLFEELILRPYFGISLSDYGLSAA